MVVFPPINTMRVHFENVPSLGERKKKVLEDRKYIHQLLGRPTFVDAAALGPHAHRPRLV